VGRHAVSLECGLSSAGPVVTRAPSQVEEIRATVRATNTLKRKEATEATPPPP